MAQLGNPDYALAGGSCVSRPNCAHDHPDAPLMFAIGCALDARAPDTFLHAIFPPYPSDALAGGDPGWMWYDEQTADGLRIIVEIDDVMAPPRGMRNAYTPAKVRYEVRAALGNLALWSPSSLAVIDAVIRKFDLGSAMALDDCAPIPPWDGTLPKFKILNA